MGGSNAPVAVVMAGGSGTRFWPASRRALPKQYLPLVGKTPMVAETVERIAPLVPADRVFVLSTQAQRALLEKHVPRVEHRILEPAARNTAPCLMLALREMKRAGVSPETVMIVLPADHHIADVPAFLALLREGAALASAKRSLVTLGIVPTSPHTGYGYIEQDVASPPAVKRFVEKPDRATAERFLREGRFLWNAGIFLWRLDALEAAFRRYLPDAWNRLDAAKTPEATAEVYATLPAQPIDVAVLEKADNLSVLPAKMGWSDVGSWSALHELLRESEADNVTVSGSTTAIGAKGNLVRAPEGKTVALIGVEDLVVVDTGDTLLVMRRDQDQRVREAAEKLDRQ